MTRVMLVKLVMLVLSEASLALNYTVLATSMQNTEFEQSLLLQCLAAPLSLLPLL